LITRSAGPEAKCRCGTRIAPGGTVISLEGLPESVAPFFAYREFCSGPCARAEFLETFETLDALVDSPAGAMITDLRQTYTELGRAFAALLT
jgi:hypothetical protein